MIDFLLALMARSIREQVFQSLFDDIAPLTVCDIGDVQLGTQIRPKLYLWFDRLHHVEFNQSFQHVLV